MKLCLILVAGEQFVGYGDFTGARWTLKHGEIYVGDEVIYVPDTIPEDFRRDVSL
jgi:hypothetical protein